MIYSCIYMVIKHPDGYHSLIQKKAREGWSTLVNYNQHSTCNKLLQVLTQTCYPVDLYEECLDRITHLMREDNTNNGKIFLLQ